MVDPIILKINRKIHRNLLKRLGCKRRRFHFQKAVSALLILLLIIQFVAGIFLFVPPPKKVEAWWSGRWTYRQKLTFDNSGQAENLANFPVLVKLTASNFNFSKAQSSGQDIRFVDSDDSTLLNYEIEKWDGTNNVAYIWVNVPQIDASSSTDYIYMYYGNSGASDAQNKTGVYNSSFKDVYHFAETSGNYNDSTSNANNCTSVNVNSRTGIGQISDAPDFESTSAAHRIGCGASLITGDVTQEAWVNLESGGTRPIIQHAYQDETEAGNIAYGLEILTAAPNNNLWQQWEYGAGTNQSNTSTANVSTGVLTYVAAVRDTTNNQVIWYINGVASGSATSYTNEATGGTTGSLYMGARISSAQWFDGIIDEVRISNTIRSANWIKASYLSENNTFITFGTEEQTGTASISSATNQTFGVGDSATTISQIIITDASGAPSITAANDIRIKIPATFNMTWDETDITATIGGGAVAKVNTTVSYEDSNQTLVIDVITNFAASNSITVSGLSFKNFSAASSADNLELEVANNGVTAATDDKTITILAPTTTIASSTVQPSVLESPFTDNVLGSASIVRNASTGNVTAVTLKENGGTIDAVNDLENIELWLSSDDTWDAGDNQLGSTGNFDGADGVVTFTETFNVSTTTQYLIVRGDVKSGVTAGKTFELQFKTITTTDTVSGTPLDISGTSTVVSYWWNVNWLYRKKLTFANSAQAENLTNFPIMVKLTSSNFDFSKAQSSGQDIRFVDSDNSTELKYEIEYWDSSGQTAIIWVKVPQIDASSNSDYIYMYYGNSGASDGQNITDVWSNGYAGVYHFAEQSGNYLDSTSNNNDSTLVDLDYGPNSGRDKTDSNGLGYYPRFTSNGGSGTPSTAGDCVGVADNSSLDFGTSAFTLFVRLKSSITNHDTDITRKGSTGIAENSWWKVEWGDDNTDNRLHFLIRVSGSDYSLTYDTLAADGNWNNTWYIRSTVDTNIKMYLNGSLVSQASGNNGNISNSAGIGIGCKDTLNADYYDGNLDEVRYISTERSANWIAAENKSFNNTFLTFGSETQGVPTAPSNASAARVSDTQFTISWTDNSSNETGFKIERKTDVGSWTQIDTDTASPYVDTTTSANHSYQYRVRVYNDAGNSDYSTDSNVLYTTPSDPSAAAATYVSDAEITVSWTDNSAFEDGFKIERKTDDGSWSQIDTDTASPYSDISTSVNHKYEYRARAYKDSLNSDYATASSAVYTTPAAPTIGTPIIDSSTAITWTWTDNSNYEDSFRLDFSTGAGTDVDDLVANSTSYQTTGLTPNSQYAIHVHAYRTDREESSASGNSVAVYTLANIPSNLTLTADSVNQIIASWSANSNPSGTEYYAENTTAGTNSGWITNSSWSSTGLSCGTSYSFRVKARNGDAVPTDTISLTQSTNGCGGGGLPPAAYNSPISPAPTPENPQGGFRIIINAGDKTTNSRFVTLKLFAGSDTERMAISNFADFRDAGQEKYTASKIWNLCWQNSILQTPSTCPDGTYTVYAKFFAPWGRASEVVSDSIVLDTIPKAEIKPKPIEPTPAPEVPTPSVPEVVPEVVPKEIPAPPITIAPPIEIELNKPIFSSTQGDIVIKSITPQKPLKLVTGLSLKTSIKPSKSVQAIKVIIIFKKPKESSYLRDNLLSAFVAPAYAQVWQVAEYTLTDEDGDGIFEGEIKLPEVAGEYVIRTTLYYEDGTIEDIETETLIDPKGYVFQAINGKELRIPEAKISLFVFNPETNQFELWQAQNYGQENPQITDKTGEYEFLVPEGKYYLTIPAPGYENYQSEEFEVKEGDVINRNIELTSIKKFNWQWLIFPVILIVGIIIGIFIRLKRKHK